MKPSSLRTFNTWSFSFEEGITTRSWREVEPLRRRVSMSLSGSFTGIVSPSSGNPLPLFSPGAFPDLVPGGTPRRSFSSLPGRLGQPGDLTLQRPLAQADPAHLELAQESPRAPTERAPVVLADLELRLPLRLGDFRQFGHGLSYTLNGIPNCLSNASPRSSLPAV